MFRFILYLFVNVRIPNPATTLYSILSCMSVSRMKDMCIRTKPKKIFIKYNISTIIQMHDVQNEVRLDKSHWSPYDPFLNNIRKPLLLFSSYLFIFFHCNMNLMFLLLLLFRDSNSSAICLLSGSGTDIKKRKNNYFGRLHKSGILFTYAGRQILFQRTVTFSTVH